MKPHIRKATAADVPRLREVIEASVRSLQAADYSPAQIECALQSVYGVDSQLIADGTYLVAEVSRPQISTRRAKTRFSILPATPRKFEPSSSIPAGPAAVSAA
jgi:hypothetical protein